MNRLLLLTSAAALPMLVDASLKSTALILLAGLGALILHRSSASARHLIWLAAVLALLLVPLLSVVLPSWHILPGWAVVKAVPATADGSAFPSGQGVIASTPGPMALPPAAIFPDEANTSQSSTSSEAPPAATMVPPTPTPAAPTPDTPLALSWLIPVWALGCSFFLLRLIAAHALLRHSTRRCFPATGSLADAFSVAIRESGFRQDVRLLIDRKRTIPLVWGIFRPCLLLPDEAAHWPAEQLRSVLLHELAHLRRRDPLTQFLTQFACALHWFNPLVWLAAWRLHVERERACDDLVLAAGVRPSDYASHLLHVATRLSPSPWTHACGLAMARKSSLESRLLAILSAKVNRRSVTAVLGGIALLLGAGIAVPIAMLRAADEKPKTPNPMGSDIYVMDPTAFPEGARLYSAWNSKNGKTELVILARGKADLKIASVRSPARWTDAGVFTLGNGEKVEFERSHQTPDMVSISGRNYDLGKGRVFVLNPPQPVLQCPLFPDAIEGGDKARELAKEAIAALPTQDPGDNTLPKQRRKVDWSKFTSSDLKTPFNPEEALRLAKTPAKSEDDYRKLIYQILKGAAENATELRPLLDLERDGHPGLAPVLSAYDYAINGNQSALRSILDQLAAEPEGEDTWAALALGFIDEWELSIPAFEKHYAGNNDGSRGECVSLFWETRKHLFPERYARFQVQRMSSTDSAPQVAEVPSKTEGNTVSPVGQEAPAPKPAAAGQTITDGIFSAQVLQADGLEPVVILTGRALRASPDSTNRAGSVTVNVATSEKTITIRYTWPENAPGFLDLKRGIFPVTRFDLSRGRVFFVHFEKLEFSADVFQVPTEVRFPEITSPESLTQAATAVASWFAASDDRARWERSRVVVPDVDYKTGQPLDTAADKIVWGEANDVGLKLGLGGLEPGASFPVGQQLPIKQYIRNDSSKTITFSPTQIFNEGVGGELIRVADGKIFPHKKGYPWQMFFDRVRLAPGHYIALGSGPMRTIMAEKDGSSPGGMDMMGHGFTVLPGQYTLQLKHEIGQFLGRPANFNFGDPRGAPGLGEWTGVLTSAAVPLRLVDGQVKTAKAGDSEAFGTRYLIAFDKGVIKLRYYKGYPNMAQTGGPWEDQSRDWKVPTADGNYLAAWAMGGNGLWVKDASGITHLMVKDVLTETGKWTRDQASGGLGGMPAGVRAALELPPAAAWQPFDFKTLPASPGAAIIDGGFFAMSIAPGTVLKVPHKGRGFFIESGGSVYGPAEGNPVVELGLTGLLRAKLDESPNTAGLEMLRHMIAEGRGPIRDCAFRLLAELKAPQAPFDYDAVFHAMIQASIEDDHGPKELTPEAHLGYGRFHTLFHSTRLEWERTRPLLAAGKYQTGEALSADPTIVWTPGTDGISLGISGLPADTNLSIGQSVPVALYLRNDNAAPVKLSAPSEHNAVVQIVLTDASGKSHRAHYSFSAPLTGYSHYTFDPGTGAKVAAFDLEAHATPDEANRAEHKEGKAHNPRLAVPAGAYELHFEYRNYQENPVPKSGGAEWTGKIAAKPMPLKIAAATPEPDGAIVTNRPGARQRKVDWSKFPSYDKLSNPFDPGEALRVAAAVQEGSSEDVRRLMFLILQASVEKSPELQPLLKEEGLRKKDDEYRSIALALAAYDYSVNDNKEGLQIILDELAKGPAGGDVQAAVPLGFIDEWDVSMAAHEKHFARTDGAGGESARLFWEKRMYLFPESFKKFQSQRLVENKLDEDSLRGTWQGSSDGVNATLTFGEADKLNISSADAKIEVSLTQIVAPSGKLVTLMAPRANTGSVPCGRLRRGAEGTLLLSLWPDTSEATRFPRVNDIVLTIQPENLPRNEGPPKTAATKITPDTLIRAWRSTLNGERLLISFHRPPVETEVQVDIYTGDATIGALGAFKIASDGTSAALGVHDGKGGQVPFGTLHPIDAYTMRLDSGVIEGRAATLAVLTRAPKPPATEPEQKEARELFAMWKATANDDGTIPGTFIGELATEVRAYVKAKSNLDSAAKLPKLLPRFVTSRDWTQAEAIQLLDDVAYYSTAPIEARVAKAKLPSGPMWRTMVEFQDIPVAIAKWSGAKDGLRIGSRVVGGQWSAGGSVRVELWLHNASGKDVSFRTAGPNRQDVEVIFTAIDAEGNEHRPEPDPTLLFAPLLDCTLPAGHVAMVKEFDVTFADADNDVRTSLGNRFRDLEPGNYQLRSMLWLAMPESAKSDKHIELTAPDFPFTLGGAEVETDDEAKPARKSGAAN